MTEKTKWIRAQELLTADYRCAGCHLPLVATRVLGGIWGDWARNIPAPEV